MGNLTGSKIYKRSSKSSVKIIHLKTLQFTPTLLSQVESNLEAGCLGRFELSLKPLGLHDVGCGTSEGIFVPHRLTNY